MEAAPYHRLARTRTYRWWKPLVELLFMLVAGLALAAAVLTAGGALVGRQSDGALGLAFVCLALAAFIPASLIAASLFRRASSLSSVVGRLRWRWLARCLSVAIPATLGAYVVVFLVLSFVVAPDPAADAASTPGLRELAVLALPIVFLVPLQCAGEEYAFRGVLVQCLGAWVKRPHAAVVISALAFAALHLPENLAVGALLALTGGLLALLAIRTGGLEASIALHTANNMIGFSFAALAGRSDEWLSKLNEGIDYPALVAQTIVLVTVFALLMRLAARHRPETSAPPLADAT